MNQRIEFIDIAKGIGILLVIIGHVEHLPSGIRSIIYSFHMPLFFILSGYFFREESVLQSAKRMFPSLIIPYFVIGGIIRIGNIIKNYANEQPFDIEDALTLLGVCWKVDERVVSVGAIWFLVVLFISKLFVQMAIKNKYGISYLIVIATLSLFLTKYFQIVLPFGIEQACVCSLFVYVGFLCKKIELFKIEISKILITVLIISILPFLVKFGIATRTNNYPFGIINVITSSVMSILVIYFIKIIFDYEGKVLRGIKCFLLWCGQCSLIILSVHSIEARFFTFNSHNWIYESFIRIIVILSLSWIYIILFKRKKIKK